jgi:dTDP-4-dehydrorhamnose reductase
MLLLIGGESKIGAAMYCHVAARGGAVIATTRRQIDGQARGQVVGNPFPQRPLFDLSRPLDGWEPPPGTHAACILAGVTRLTACAADPPGSAYLNVPQTLALARRLLEYGIFVVFLSSNLVFDGSQPSTSVDAATVPVSEYGKQKARAEAGLRVHMDRGAPVAILRLSKVLSSETVLMSDWADTLSRGRPIRAFSDMRLAPVPADLVCEAIGALLGAQSPGVFQLSGPRDVSYAEAARDLARCVGADPGLVESASAGFADLPAGATPRHTTLDSTLMRSRFGIAVPDAGEVIESLYVSAQKPIAGAAA